MTVQPIERTDLDIIEALDWEHVPQCEHRSHPYDPRIHAGDAYALIRFTCPCGRDVSAYVCKPWLAHARAGKTICRDCERMARGDCYVVLSIVGGAL